jgi:hypothetical protein
MVPDGTGDIPGRYGVVKERDCAMETPKPRNAPDSATEDRPARKSSVIQPVKRDDDVALETYEQSPERTGGDERNRPASPDGALPDRERLTPD